MWFKGVWIYKQAHPGGRQEWQRNCLGIYWTPEAFTGPFQSPQEGQASKCPGSEALRCVDQITDLACYNRAPQISDCRAQSLRLSYALPRHQQSLPLRICTSWKAHLSCAALLGGRPWAQGNQEPLCVAWKESLPHHPIINPVQAQSTSFRSANATGSPT